MTFVRDGNVYEAGHTREFDIGCPLCNSLLYIYQGHIQDLDGLRCSHALFLVNIGFFFVNEVPKILYLSWPTNDGDKLIKQHWHLKSLSG